jgi:hypothetical protein
MSIEVGFEAEVDLTGGETKSQKRETKKSDLSQRVYSKTLNPNSIPLVGGNGTLDLATQYGPIVGFMWSVRRITLYGYSAGTVNVLIDDLEPVAFPSAGTFTFGKSELLLDQGQRLVFTATGVTGAVQVFGAADVFPRNMLPIYMGIGDIEI